MDENQVIQQLDELKGIVLQGLSAINIKVDNMEQRLSTVDEKVDKIKQDVARVQSDVDILFVRTGVMDAHMEAFGRRLDTLEEHTVERQEQFEERVMDEFQKQADTFIERQDAIEQRMVVRLGDLEQRMITRQKAYEDAMQEQFNILVDSIEARIIRSQQEILAWVENRVFPKTDALSDGFKIVLEKTTGLESRIEALENKFSA